MGTWGQTPTTVWESSINFKEPSNVHLRTGLEVEPAKTHWTAANKKPIKNRLRTIQEPFESRLRTI